MRQEATRHHVFVDESKARDYLLAATSVPTVSLPAARRAVRSLILPGQHRLHMAKESDRRRRHVLDVFRELPVATVVYRAHRTSGREVVRRASCLATLVSQVARHCDALCLERDETLVVRDRQQIIEAAHRAGRRVPHRHASATEEPLLAIPDAVAWAWAKGGDWRARCGSVSEWRVTT